MSARCFASARERLASVLESKKAWEEAIELRRGALEVYRAIAEAEPADLKRQGSLEGAYDALANALEGSGNLAGSLEVEQAALAFCVRLAERMPGKPDLLRDVSVQHNRIGSTHLSMGKPDAAAASHRAALSVMERIVRDAKSAHAGIDFDVNIGDDAGIFRSSIDGLNHVDSINRRR